MHFGCYPDITEHMFKGFLTGDQEAAEPPGTAGNVFYGPYGPCVDGITLRRPPQLQIVFENGPIEA